MKFRLKNMIPVTLATALLFAGCASNPSYSISAADSATESAAPGQSDSGSSLTADNGNGQADSGSSQSAVSETGQSAVSGTSSQDADTSQIFSARDLSGEYDLKEAVSIQVNGSSASCSASGVEITESVVTIKEAGTYVISGKLDNGSIIVDVSKNDKVQLVLDGAEIVSDSFAAIYVKQADKVFVTLADGTENTLANGGTFTQIDDNDVDAVVFAKDDITLNGSGTLQISSPAGHGISGKDEVTITGGTINIEAAKCAVKAKDSIAIADGTFQFVTKADGLHAENSDDETLGNIYIAGGSFSIQVSDDAIHANTLLRIDGGEFDITASEGLEGTYIIINDGTVRINASDDGVNAAYKSSAYTPTFEMNGGSLTINMGAGDTDAVDSNADIVINGGTINITGQSSFDYDGNAQYNGGTIIVNGETVNSIPNQMMGGGMRGGQFGGKRGGKF